MGELGGFLKIHRVERRKRPIAERVHDFKEYEFPADEPGCASRARAAWTAASRSATTGCPLGNLIPDWNDLVYREPLAGRDRRAPRHEQLPRVHRPHLPGAVRGRLRPRHQRRRRHDQADRAVDHRPRLGRGLGQARAAAVPHRQDGRGRRLRPGRHGRRRRAQQARPQGHPVRAQRPHRRPAALRRAGLQARQGRRAAARRPDRAGGHRDAHRRATSASTSRPTSCASSTTPSSCRSARRSRATCRCPGRELDGVHFAMEYLELRNRFVGGRAPRGHADQRRRQARRDHRRRRHRRRLPRQLAPRGARVGHPVRGAARAAARAPRRPDAVAALAADPAHLRRARGGRRPRVSA